MSEIRRCGILVMTSFILYSCGGNSSSSAGVAGSASIVMGPSTAARGLRSAKRPKSAGSRTCPTDGNWFLTPDKAHVTFTKISFTTTDGSLTTSTFTNCTATYDKTLASGTQLLSCPITFPQGQIKEYMLYYSPSFDVQVADATNCIYTDPSSSSGLSNSAPSGGAAFATFTVTAQQQNNGDFVQDTNLPTPFTVSAGDSPTLSITTDMIHTMFITASAGAMTFTGAQSPSPLVFVYGNFAGVGKSEFYSSSGSVGNINVGSQTSEGSAFRVAYLPSGEAAHVWAGYIPNCVFGNYPTEAWNVSASSSAANSSNGYKEGGYLGLDPNTGAHGTLAWSMPVDFTYAAYRSLVELPRATTLGGTTTASCNFLNGTAAPAPSSGSTYASGAPTLGTPVYTQAVTLLAN